MPASTATITWTTRRATLWQARRDGEHSGGPPRAIPTVFVCSREPERKHDRSIQNPMAGIGISPWFHTCTVSSHAHEATWPSLNMLKSQPTVNSVQRQPPD
jgi:hypothetical protein